MFESNFTGDYPGVDDMVKFVKDRVAAFEVASASAMKRPYTTGNNNKSGSPTNVKSDRRSKMVLVATSSRSSTNKFLFCQADHTNEKYKKFIALAVPDRRKLAQEKRVCYRWLSSSHWANKCFQKKPFDQCKDQSHVGPIGPFSTMMTLLHVRIVSIELNI